MSNQLLSWYDINRRRFPWRHALEAPFHTPYAIWISEMMLQQTGTSVVVPYYQRFMQSFPTLEHVAHASQEDILHVWQGLGYYRRARYIHQAAQHMMRYGMPESYDQWLDLPGIGPYTAAALTTIILNQPAVAIDGNIRRVVRRFLGIQGVCSDTVLQQHAGNLLPSERWGDYTQALMDLGATVCTPRTWQCHQCPLHQRCIAHQMGTQEVCLPPSAVVRAQPYHAQIYVVTRSHDQAIWMHPEHTKGLWQGLWRFLGSAWHTDASLLSAPTSSRWRHHGVVNHALTHYRCTAQVWSLTIHDPQSSWTKRLQNATPQGRWVNFSQEAPPHSRLMRKIWTKVHTD